MNCFRRTNDGHRCNVVLLDGQELAEEIQDDTLGQDLLDRVLRRLTLQETIYFGLRYMHASRQPHWLHPNKKISKQLKGTSSFTLYFCVKFYATDPCKLRDEITRYQFFLQVKKDIVDGRLPVPLELSAELGAYVAQSDLGDYDPSVHSEGYCRQFQLSPGHPTPEQSIAQIHRTLAGQSPATVEAALLEKVRWLDMYGADLYPVVGEDNSETYVGLAPSGVLVLRGKGRVNNYFWPRITKVFCKKNCLMMRTRDNDNEEHTISFACASRLACQLLLQSCTEQQEFFRQALANPPGATSTRSGRSEARRGSSAPSTQRQRGRREAGALNADLEQELPGPDGDMIRPSVCHKSVSVPQPVQSASSLYRVSSANVASKSPPDSPRSAHSALLSANQLPGLFNNNPITKTRSRTSMDSQSSADSRTQRRSRHRREPSAGSDVSSGQSSLRSSRRYRGRRAESGSDSDRSGGSRRHRSRRHRSDTGHLSAAAGTELVDSEPQWREVQRLQAERLRPSGYQNSGMETETELSYQPKRRVKRHSRSRSRSRSPETNRNRRLPAELRRHLQFGLVEPPSDTAGDIPYTKVTTEQRMPRIRYATKRSQKGSSVDGRSDVVSEPPLPASPPQGGTPDGVLSPTAEYPTPAATYPTPAATYPAPAAAYPAPAAAYPAPAAAYPAPAAAYPAPAAAYPAPASAYPAPAAAYPVPGSLQAPLRSSAANTLSSYYVRAAPSERGRELAAATDRASSAMVGSGPRALTSGQVTRPADTQYDNSDSGLGNESPTEFTRSTAQPPSTSTAGSRTVTSQGERPTARTQDVVTSL